MARRPALAPGHGLLPRRQGAEAEVGEPDDMTLLVTG
jgi:hypothetical protein